MEDKKKIKIYYGLLITLVVFMGVSYAWFRLKRKLIVMLLELELV